MFRAARPSASHIDPITQTHYDLSKAGLNVPKGWFNDLQSLTTAVNRDPPVVELVIAQKKKAGHDLMLPLLTNLNGHILFLGGNSSNTESGGVLYIRNWDYDFFGFITKPVGLKDVVRGLDEHGSAVLDFKEIEKDEE